MSHLVHLLFISVMVSTAGCATHRSNTAEYEEHLTVRFVEFPPPQQLLAGVGPAELVATVGLTALSQAVKWESAKYDQQSSAVLGDQAFKYVHAVSNFHNGDEPREWDLALSYGYKGFIGILRTLNKKKDAKDWLSRMREWLTFYEQPANLEVVDETLVDAIRQSLRSCDPRLAGDEANKLLDSLVPLQDAKDKQEHLGMVALVRLVPDEPRPSSSKIIEVKARRISNGASPYGESTTYRIELLGYRYSAIKAKNLSFHIPFTDWDRTESLMSLSFKGPKGDTRFTSGRFDIQTDFTLDWDRDAAMRGDASPWVGCQSNNGAVYPLKSSDPIRVWNLSTFAIHLSLSESSALKDQLLRASEKLKDVDIK